jgi:hypothetical protein
MLPGWAVGLIRTALQSGYGLLVAWLLARGVEIPAEMPEAVVGVVVALIIGAVAGAVQWAERREGTNVVARFVRLLARILMWGARVARYPRQVERPADGAVRRTAYQ